MVQAVLASAPLPGRRADSGAANEHGLLFLIIGLSTAANSPLVAISRETPSLFRRSRQPIFLLFASS
jgi:hypothetical protein